jgi:hypothetical protein
MAIYAGRSISPRFIRRSFSIVGHHFGATEGNLWERHDSRHHARRLGSIIGGIMSAACAVTGGARWRWRVARGIAISAKATGATMCENATGSRNQMKRTMNLDILLCVIRNAPEDDLPLLHHLRATCRAARKHAACAIAVRRAGLLKHVQAGRQAVLMHVSSPGYSEGLSRTQRFLREYLTKTYGLERKYQTSTPKTLTRPSIRFYDIWIPSDVHAASFVSDLFFLARQGYAVYIYLHRRKLTEHPGDALVCLLKSSEGIHVTDKANGSRRSPTDRTGMFHIAAAPPPGASR